jgi:molybdopterin-guanine dinucleotide biosynthesis protein A
VDIPAVAYQNAESGYPEPLLAIYEAEVGTALQLWREQGNHSLRLFLQNIEARLILPLEPACLMSVDTPEIAQKLNLYPYPIRYI